jgi:hypothetical protein
MSAMGRDSLPWLNEDGSHRPARVRPAGIHPITAGRADRKARVQRRNDS